MGSSPASLPEAPVDPLEISWTAPPSCPGLDAVRRQAQTRLDEPGAPVVAEATVTGSDADGWRMVITVRGPEGTDERQVHAASCDELVEAAGLFISVAASVRPQDPGGSTRDAESGGSSPEAESGGSSPDAEPRGSATDAESVPDLVAPPPEPDGPPTPEPDGLPAPSSAASTTPRPSDKPNRPWQALVRLEGAARFFALLPQSVGAAVGGAVGVRLPSTWLRVEARAGYSFAQRATYVGSAIGGDIDLWTVGASGCFEPQRGSLSFPLCGGLQAGAMRGRSVGVPEQGSAGSAFVGLPLGAAVSWAPWPWLALSLGPRAMVSLRRPRFHVRDLDLLFRAGPAALSVVGGIEFRFP